jgi:hypothetical protein
MTQNYKTYTIFYLICFFLVINFYKIIKDENKLLRKKVDLYLKSKKKATLLFGPIEKWDTSKVTDMSNLFSVKRNKLNRSFNGDITKWNTAKVKTMKNMFKGAKSFSKNIRLWTVSDKTVLTNMFEDATNMINRYNLLTSFNTTPDVEFFNVSPDTTTTTGVIPWDTTTNILQYNNGVETPVQLAGFNLTHTENYAGYNIQYTTGAQPDDNCLVYYNFYNNFVYSNLVNTANIIYSSGTNYNNLNSLNGTKSNIPSIRIPLNADYWLNGSGVGSQIYNTLGTNMTATQYQNMIISMVYYLMNPTSNQYTTFTGTANGCVVVLDLHWNYSSGLNTSGTYDSSDENSTPPQQTAMAVANNSIAFWNSIYTIFGLDNNGVELQSTFSTINTTDISSGEGAGTQVQLTADMKQNVFFELYNEPYLDQISADQGSGYAAYSDYNNTFNMYIQGSEYYTGNPIEDTASGTTLTYNVAGMGTLYDNIRSNCSNVIILGGAESYCTFAGYNYIAYGNGTTVPNTFITNTYGSGDLCYNCFTKLNQAVISGSIPVLDTSGNLTGSLYANNSSGLTGVISNIHAYTNSGYSNYPGYMYNTTNTDVTTCPNNGNQQPALANFLQALTQGTNPDYTSFDSPASTGTVDCSDFQISFPIISTEYGQFNLPWINSSGTTYTSLYNQDPSSVSQGTSSDWYGVQTTLNTTYYCGEYYDENGVATNAPFNVGLYETFNQFNVSYLIWVLSPSVTDFNQNDVLQVNYSSTTTSTSTLTLLQDSEINITTPGQNAFDMNFIFQKYHLGVTGAITE